MADVTVIGNLTDAPELRWTNNGKAVASFTVAVSERYFDKKTNEWKDTDPWFARCTAWGELAEHANQSLHKGIRVIGHGKIKQRNYEVDGQRRSSVEVELYDVGASLKYGTTAFTKAQRGDTQSHAGAPQTGFAGNPSPQDPFASQNGGWAQQPLDTEAPF